ncbi:MAG: EAL domain-containing protein [Gammaproteobacteria bacterium]|nr:EAL domain-containing protein [Gammaproteobacteria bacterium]
MSDGFDKNRTISDYATLFQGIVPGFQGLYCYDRSVNAFFEYSVADAPEFSLEYEDQLKHILAEPVLAREQGVIDLGSIVAFVVPFSGEEDRVLGLFVILVDKASSLSYQSCEKLVAPVMRSMKREMTLRYRLLAAYKKLDVRSAEENLLHQIEKLAHLRRTSEETLSHILLLCRKFLKVRGAALLVPDKQMRFFEGEALDPVEIHLMFNEMVGHDMTHTGMRPAPADPVRNSAEVDVLALPIGHDRHDPIGVLVFNGWGDSGFSLRRRRRVGRFVASHIEDVITRDYDALTGLMSWSLFEQRLLELCGEAGSVRAGSYVMYLDIDRLHVINENLGPAQGDEVVANFARIMRERLSGHLITRINGDNFGALIVGKDLDYVQKLAGEIVEAFAGITFGLGDKKERGSVSIGIAPIIDDADTGNAVMAPAQVACKAAKDRGRGRVESYQQEDLSIIQRMDDIQLVGDIRSAIENGRLAIVGQPIVPLSESDWLTYFEVLVRLLDAEGNLVMPADFFSSAERYQLMEELDRWVVTETLNQLSSRIDRLAGMPLRIAINLSGQSMGSETFLSFVESELDRSGVPAEMLCFEITETVAIANLQRAQHLMHTLKKRGCYFSLDDFGTGLSSFAYLKLFPVNTLKIDGSFVRDLTTNVVSQSVVAAISEVARVMELDTVAEYVQSEEALTLLRNLGVTYGQGYLLGEPASLSAALDQLPADKLADSRSA